jgi:hypothetical protein
MPHLCTSIVNNHSRYNKSEDNEEAVVAAEPGSTGGQYYVISALKAVRIPVVNYILETKKVMHAEVDKTESDSSHDYLWLVVIVHLTFVISNRYTG